MQCESGPIMCMSYVRRLTKQGLTFEYTDPDDELDILSLW